MMTNEQLVETVARALARSHGLGDHMPNIDAWMRDARTAVSAITAIKASVPEWQPIETAPWGAHFLTAYFYHEGGEWIYDIAMLHRDHVCGVNEGAAPFTHWMPLHSPSDSKPGEDRNG